MWNPGHMTNREASACRTEIKKAMAHNELPARDMKGKGFYQRIRNKARSMAERGRQEYSRPFGFSLHKKRLIVSRYFRRVIIKRRLEHRPEWGRDR